MNKHNSVPNIRFRSFEDNWIEKSFQEILTINSGKDYKNLSLGNIPVYGTGGLMLYVNKSLSNKDAIGIGRKGTINKPQYLRAPFWTVDTLFFMIPRKNFDISFIFCLSQKINWKKYDESTGLPSLSKKVIGKINSYVPVIKEQQEIGDFFSKLDKLLDLQQQKIDKLELLKKALLQTLFPKHDAQIPELRFKGFEGDWNEKRLNSITKRLDNYRKPITANKRLSGQTPYYGANGIQDYVKGYTHEGEFVLIAEDGANDVRNYPVRFVKGYIWVNNHAHVLQAKVGTSNNLFLAYSLKNRNLLPYLVGSGRMKLNADVLMNLLLKIPDLNEQQKIGNLLSKVDQLIELENKKLQNFQQVKKCLLQNMFVE